VRVDIQFSSAANDWPALRDAVLRAEQDGYAATWVFDHFDGSSLRGDRPVLECTTLLGALAAATRTIHVGTLVANVANRHPAVLAAAALSAQRISAGRLLLGIGAGTAPGTRWATEHERRGIPLRAAMADRHQAVEEQIGVLRATCPSVPVIVGVNTVALATVAGRCADGVNVFIDHPRAESLLDAASRAAESTTNAHFVRTAYTLGERDAALPTAERLRLDRLIVTDLGPLP
jgi:alkanesulfonate monooxygenase SsuD/methylene tetrahydromethanopterin reductase-like flavin-dependent oxidoreductase (luciferase family)